MFFATVNQMFSSSSQLLTEYAVTKLLSTVQTLKQCSTNQIVEHSSDNETVLDSIQKLGGATEHLIDGSEKCICQLGFEF